MRVIAAPAEHAPDLTIDAVVIEDDTCHVLGTEPVARVTREPPRRLLARAASAQPAEPGHVVVRPGMPLRFHAVVHDLGVEPSWREAWVEAALAAVFREVELRRLRTVSLPPLGSLHGELRVERFAQLLAATLERLTPETLDAVWLVTAAGRSSVELAPLQRFGLIIRP